MSSLFLDDFVAKLDDVIALSGDFIRPWISSAQILGRCRNELQLDFNVGAHFGKESLGLSFCFSRITSDFVAILLSSRSQHPFRTSW